MHVSFGRTKHILQTIRYELIAFHRVSLRPYQNKVEGRFDTFSVQYSSEDIPMKFRCYGMLWTDRDTIALCTGLSLPQQVLIGNKARPIDTAPKTVEFDYQ